jgi:hypothetical protein
MMASAYNYAIPVALPFVVSRGLFAIKKRVTRNGSTRKLIEKRDRS